MADYKLWNALKDAKKYRWVELSHSLNNESPYWSGIPEGSVELAKTVWDWGKPELECLIQTFKFPGQFGTHIDFPGHFIKGKALSEKYDVNDLIFPLVVIDISEQAKKDPRYAVTVEDIKAYEAKYGPIPDGALVALRSDWYKKWPDMDALSGIDAEGKENAPGWSLEKHWSISTRCATPPPTATKRWIPIPLRWRRKRVTLPASAMFWTTTSCRWRCLQIWIKFSLPVRWSSFLILALKVQLVCPHGSGPLPNKSGEVGKCPLKKQKQIWKKKAWETMSLC